MGLFSLASLQFLHPFLAWPLVSTPGGCFGGSGALPLLKRLSWSESGLSLLILSHSGFSNGAQACELPHQRGEVPAQG